MESGAGRPGCRSCSVRRPRGRTPIWHRRHPEPQGSVVSSEGSPPGRRAWTSAAARAGVPGWDRRRRTRPGEPVLSPRRSAGSTGSRERRRAARQGPAIRIARSSRKSRLPVGSVPLRGPPAPAGQRPLGGAAAGPRAGPGWRRRRPSACPGGWRTCSSRIQTPDTPGAEDDPRRCRDQVISRHRAVLAAGGVPPVDPAVMPAR